jgi:hypothetical protein
MGDLSVIEARAEAEMAPVLEKAKAFAVVDMPSYETADAIINEIRIRVKDREIELGPMKETATKAWKAAVALWKKFVDDPLDACKTLDRKRYAWKKAEDDRRAREAAEERRKEEKRIADEKLELAARLEKAGMKDQAETVLSAPCAPVSVSDPVKVGKAAGESHLENWQARVVDAALVPREFLTPDLVALGKYAKLMKGKAKVAGVVFEDVGSVRRRS